MRKEKYRLQYHLMPPTGWMNDPNGFCYYEEHIISFFSIHQMMCTEEQNIGDIIVLGI